jgi:hypothetical protein
LLTGFPFSYVTLAGDSPPAGDLLLCCTTKKKARKRTPLSRPLRGFPPTVGFAHPTGYGGAEHAPRNPTFALPAMPGGVFANSPCGLKHAKPFFRPSSPPVGAPEGRGNAGDQRPVPDSSSAGARCIRKARSAPAEQRTSRRGLPARLSEPEGRVPRRPPAGSSAGQSAEGRPGVAGRLLCLLSWRSKKGGRLPGRNPGQPLAKHRNTVPQGLTGSRSNGMRQRPSRKVRKALHPRQARLTEPGVPARGRAYIPNANRANKFDPTVPPATVMAYLHGLGVLGRPFRLTS